jgi:LacI family transcriptional regulator
MRLIVGNTGGDEEHERDLVNDFASRRVDGMIVVPAGADHGHLHHNDLPDTPVVLATRPGRGVDLDTVLVDDCGGAQAATNRLVAAGHTRIGFLGLNESVWNITERFRGFTTALRQAKLKPQARHVRRNRSSIAAAEKAAGDLLAIRNPPTALFCANNLNTIGALRAIGAQRGTGGTPVIAGFDDLDLADMVGVPLILVTYDAQAIGREAAQMLLARLRHDRRQPSPPTRTAVIETQIIEHGLTSTRVPREAT